jgi:hypothetical protein
MAVASLDVTWLVKDMDPSLRWGDAGERERRESGASEPEAMKPRERVANPLKIIAGRMLRKFAYAPFRH